ncbi:hypothetical protein D9756_000753 [Leucocoprinus leucothites]|uniref:Uncharacterized protein n=1 Tax=Leucocoprinus leucothites TaxID=201217 RepID=A0A8H5GGB6_9AGAR|nr:hypothetical protein D9756_000753 [Leucoagaricus leucothites]
MQISSLRLSGTNDENNEIPFDQFISTLRNFIETLITASSSKREIWLIPPFGDHSAEEDCSEYRKVLLLEEPDTPPALSATVPVFIYDIQRGMGKALTVDGLHPTAEGQELLATNFAEFVKARWDVVRRQSENTKSRNGGT